LYQKENLKMKGRKMKKRVKTSVLTVLFIYLLLAAGAMAQPANSKPRNFGPPPGGPDGTGRPGGIMYVLQKLDLTEQQQSQIKTILDNNRDKMKTAHQAVIKAQQTLEQAVIGDANETVIRDTATAIGIAIGNEAILKAATMTQIKSLLTADQQKKLKETLAARPQRPDRPGHQRHDPNMPPPPDDPNAMPPCSQD